MNMCLSVRMLHTQVFECDENINMTDFGMSSGCTQYIKIPFNSKFYEYIFV